MNQQQPMQKSMQSASSSLTAQVAQPPPDIVMNNFGRDIFLKKFSNKNGLTHLFKLHVFMI